MTDEAELIALLAAAARLGRADVDATLFADLDRAAAYRVQTQRGLDQQRQALAERDAASGTLGSGGFDSQARGLGQQAAESNSQFTGNLGMHLFDQQQQQLTSAIAAAQQAGQFSTAQALQLKLAQMQAAAQNNQLGFNYAQLETNANRDALLAMLGL